MLRGAQRGPALFRSVAIAGSRTRRPQKVAFPAIGVDQSAGVIACPHEKPLRASDHAYSGQARWMSAAGPGGMGGKNNEPRPEPDGFLRRALGRVLGKESVVRFLTARGS